MRVQNLNFKTKWGLEIRRSIMELQLSCRILRVLIVTTVLLVGASFSTRWRVSVKAIRSNLISQSFELLRNDGHIFYIFTLSWAERIIDKWTGSTRQCGVIVRPQSRPKSLHRLVDILLLHVNLALRFHFSTSCSLQVSCSSRASKPLVCSNSIGPIHMGSDREKRKPKLCRRAAKCTFVFRVLASVRSRKQPSEVTECGICSPPLDRQWKDRFDLFVGTLEVSAKSIFRRCCSLFFNHPNFCGSHDSWPTKELLENKPQNRSIVRQKQSLAAALSAQAERIDRQLIASRIRIISSFVCLQFARRCTT